MHDEQCVCTSSATSAGRCKLALPAKLLVFGANDYFGHNNLFKGKIASFGPKGMF